MTKTDVDKLKDEEMEQLKKVEVEAEEVGLEDLIILGERKKIPIHITFPNEDGTKSKSKALVRQLTLKELDSIQLKNNKLGTTNKIILKKALFKSTGEPFNDSELDVLPIGVVNKVAEKILDLSGVDVPKQNKIGDF